MGEPQNQQSPRPAITVIVPTYNRARFLGRSLESVLNQSLPPTEVIVVDDGSVDATGEVLAKFDGRVQVIRKTNGGKASALNIGLARASGELIWIFDDDDIALPNALEKMVAALMQHPECGFSYGSYQHLSEDEDGATTLTQPRLFINCSLDFRLSVLERCYIFQPGMLVRRSCYDAVGPFDEALVRSQDYEMLIRLSRKYDGINVGDILFYQRQHSGVRGSAGSPVAGEKKENAWIQYDRIIFSRIHHTYPLREYVPGRIPAYAKLSTAQERTALLERCCVMARKGMWDFAADDLRSVAELMQAGGNSRFSASEAATLRRFFGPYSYADHTLAEGAAFFASLREHMPVFCKWRAAYLLCSPWLLELVFCVRGAHTRYFLGTARKLFLFCLMFARHLRSSERPLGSLPGIEP